MKNRRGLLALMLAVVMVLAMGMTVFGAPEKVNLSVNPVAGHTYTAYQLFVGDLATDEEGKQTLSNVKWGSAVKSPITVNSTEYYPVKDEAVPQEVLDYLATLDSKTATDPAQATADIISALIDTNKPGIELSATAVQVDTGYYVVIDRYVNSAAEQTTTISTNIVEIVGPTEIQPKAGSVESEKKVQDINDSTGAVTTTEEGATLIDSADYDIGDHIPYTLTFKLPENFSAFKDYELVFRDDMSIGLTYDAGSAKIQIGTAEPVEYDDPMPISDSSYNGGTAWEWNIDLSEYLDPNEELYGTLTGEDIITITYTATLNSNAVINVPGNPNKYQVEYPSNPNEEGGGEPGKTPWDTNVVFTYKTVFFKEDGKTHKPLTGADFELFKFVKSDDGAEKYNGLTGDWVNVTELGEGQNRPYKATENYEKEIEGNTVTATAAKFTFAGLDDGYYKLVETQTPASYNTLEDQYFEITATHEVESDNPKLTELKGTDGEEFVMTPVKDTENNYTGELDITIDNNKGSVLPSTGGIGTTIFYVVGGVLVVLAVVFLALRRRNSGKAE